MTNHKLEDIAVQQCIAMHERQVVKTQHGNYCKMDQAPCIYYCNTKFAWVDGEPLHYCRNNDYDWLMGRKA